MKIPTQCPSCNSSLEEVNFQLFCRNTSCEAQSSKKVQAYAKNMKIKGLGVKSIEKLELVDVPEIYELTLEELTTILGKVGETIYNNIIKTSLTDFSTFLASLSIPLIGQTASKKIGSYCNSLSTLSDSLLVKAGIGEKARGNLINWLDTNMEEYSCLPVKFNKMETLVKTNLELGTVCITGKLANFANRTQAKACLEKLGYKVVGTVSKTLGHLVDEHDASSSKNTKAKALNIPITTMQQLINVAGEYNNV